jgi:hypothetical protein
MEQNQITGKNEFLKRIKCKVYCANLETRTRWNGKNYVDEDEAIVTPIKLKIGYNQEEYDLFLSKIDIPFEDVSSWNGRLYGNIWMEDGSWYTIKYDEEYMWQSFYHHKLPEIPTELLNQ